MHRWQRKYIVAIEIFNNEILAPGSTSGEGVAASEVVASTPVEEADPEVLENLISVTVGDSEGSSESTGEEVVAVEEGEVTFEGVVTDEPAPRPADPPATVVTEEVRTPATRGNPTAAEQAEAERVAQQQELEQLRSQLETMREKEEARRRELAAREEARRAQEEAAALAMETSSADIPAGDEGDTGGLWLPGGDDTGVAEDGSFGGDEGFQSGMDDGGDEDRLREEIECLRQERIALKKPSVSVKPI